MNNAFILILFMLVMLSPEIRAQSLEKMLAEDLKSLGYEVVADSVNTSRFLATLPASIYEDAEFSFYAQVVSLGKNKGIGIFKGVDWIDAKDSVRHFLASQYFIKRNALLPCASYSGVYSEDGEFGIGITRMIEATCYNRELLSGVLKCIKNEIVATGIGNGYRSPTSPTEMGASDVFRILKSIPKSKLSK